MLKILDVLAHERVAHFCDGTFLRLYGPGRHYVWTLSGLHRFETLRTGVDCNAVGDTDLLPVDLPGQVVVQVRTFERVGVFVRGVYRATLNPGRYRFWEEAGPFDFVRVDIRGAPVAVPAEDGFPATAAGFAEATGSPSAALVLASHGQPQEVLPPGRYRVWHGGPWSVRVVPLSLQTLDVAAQDLLTSDQVPLRVKPAVSFRVVDPLAFVREPDWSNQVYTTVQLALREVVAAHDLEALVRDRSPLNDELLELARQRLPALGLALEAAAVKDVILPGEAREVFLRVTVAKKEAEALAIKRREEVAQTRQLANTAKLLEQSPVLLRLRELEHLKDIASSVERLTVVGGAELLGATLLTELAAPRA